MAILIKNGTLVTAAEQYQADLLIDGERITAQGSGLPVSADTQILNAAGKYVLPGGVDAHVHLDLPMFGTVSSDDHYTGTKAAAFGGTTTVIDFVSHDQRPLTACIEDLMEKAGPKAAVDFGFHMNITHWDDQVAKELPGLLSNGISSIKVFSAYNGRLRLQDGEIFQVLRKAGENGILTMLHAENGDVIDLLTSEIKAQGHTQPIWHARSHPNWGAVEAVLRGAALAAQAKAPLYIVHMNVAGEVDQLTYAREHGIKVLGETCPQYLFFSEEDLERPDGAKWVCSPPMRKKVDNARLWQGVMNGEIQVVATDHCPFFYDGTKPILFEGKPVAIPGKELGAGDFTKIPNGLPGVGDRLPILWTYGVGQGKISPSRFVDLCSTTPARIFGLYPRKGCLSPGSDADIVIWDPECQVKYGVQTAQHRTDYNLYEGWALQGMPETVFLRGKIIVQHNQWLGKPGMGKFLSRDPFSYQN
ncbi:MAG TPA: dihydropyrimidinase [Longilinea sp.]|nr:dihydropyrimidinase [Longilinea sp.]